MTYEQWKQDVDAALVKLCSCTSDDLPDWSYYRAYDTGVTPWNAAVDAYYAAKESFGL